MTHEQTAGKSQHLSVSFMSLVIYMKPFRPNSFRTIKLFYLIFPLYLRLCRCIEGFKADIEKQKQNLSWNIIIINSVSADVSNLFLLLLKKHFCSFFVL